VHDVAHAAARRATKVVVLPTLGQRPSEADYHTRNGTTFHVPQNGQRGVLLRTGAQAKSGPPRGHRRQAAILDPQDWDLDADKTGLKPHGDSAGPIEARGNPSGDGHGGGRDGEGARHERNVLAPLRWLDAKGSQPDAAAQALVEVITQLQGRAHPSAGDRSLALRSKLSTADWAKTARHHLASEGAAPVTLAAVREALLTASPADWSERSRSESVRLWLPVFLLNLSRPRRGAQLAQAQATLQLLERGGISKPAGVSGI
jgi:hypothetical protein